MHEKVGKVLIIVAAALLVNKYIIRSFWPPTGAVTSNPAGLLSR